MTEKIWNVADVARDRKHRAMRPTFAVPEINKCVVESWEEVQEYYRAFMAARGLEEGWFCEEHGEHIWETGDLGGFLNTKKGRLECVHDISAEAFLGMLWYAFHKGRRFGLREAGAEDDKIPGFPRG